MSADTDTRTVEIVDVAPRDGLQSDAVVLPTVLKVELIGRLVAAGVRRLEAASFVNPARVPAMADADDVMRALPRGADVTYVGLVLNERGMERAMAAGVDEVSVVVVTSDSFARENQGTDAAGTVARWANIAAAGRAAGGPPLSVVVSTAFGCPFEGEIAVGRLVEIVEGVLVAATPARLVLADTIGVAAPTDVVARVAAVAAAIPSGVTLGCHFHNTRNTGIANAYAALDAGITMFESSLAGIGGCPFAPRATGNICTEDLVYLLHRMGIETGLDLDALAAASLWLEGVLGRPTPGLYAKAGPFPRRS